MAVLLVFCLPLVFASYVFQLEDKNRHFFAFFLGIFTAALLVPAVSAILPKDALHADSLSRYISYAFFADTLVPLLITVIAVFLLSGFQSPAVSSGLFGFFTVKIYQQLFLMSSHPHIMPILFYISVYVGTLFIFDAVLHLCAEITFYYYAACGLSFFVFLAMLAGAYFGWGLWYFAQMNTVYAAVLFGGIAVLGLGFHIAVYRRIGSA